jgi:outer membrane protein assembly factor BamD
MPWSQPAAKVDPSAEALFAEGSQYFKDKRYVRAIDAFTRLKAEHPFSPLLTDAELKIADAYYLNNQYPEAINAFKEFQSLHPSNENIPFVVFRLGQAHFDQFTATDREQKNTEIAKGYFETVITTYPQSPYAAQAKEKLAKCIEYLAEHDFDVASFYFKQEKYPAARDRFEEIVRKYRGTPAAAKSLFFLGESYRREKNNIKAGLAYEALLEHYPQSKFAPEARTQLAQMEKEKQDPLAMLLMRDRRPGAPEGTTQVADTKAKEIPNLVAKTDFVYEEPGEEKSFLRRVADKMNPFSSSDDKKKPESKPESGIEMLAKKSPTQDQQTSGVTSGFWSSLNPFGSNGSTAKNSQVVDQVDNSLKQKGIDTNSQIAALKTPAADLEPLQPAPKQATMDTSKLLGDVDATLKKSGKEVKELPPPPAAEAFSDPAIQAMVVKSSSKQDAPQQSTVESGLLSAIDQKLKNQGVQPNFEAPPPIADGEQAATASTTPKKVELQPKLAVEKGPLFLNPSEVSVSAAPEKPALGEASETVKKDGPAPASDEPAVREIPRNLVKGPTEPQSASVRTADQKKSVTPADDENKNVMDYIKDDIEGIGKVLNPLRW